MARPGEGRLPRAQDPEGVLAQSWPTLPRRQGPKAPGRAQGGPAQPPRRKLSMGLEEIQDCNEESGLYVAASTPFRLLSVKLIKFIY